MSRLMVGMPRGFDFGIEGEALNRNKALTADEEMRSDRELARLFVEMFMGTGLRLVVCFSTKKAANKAKRVWGSAACARVIALGGEKEKQPKESKVNARRRVSSDGGVGFGGSRVAASTKLVTKLPDDAEVLFVVNPDQPQLAAVNTFCDTHGMDRLVVLLNMRANFASLDEPFEPVFIFDTDPLSRARSIGARQEEPLVLFRAFPEDWSLARKPKFGPPRVLLSASEQPKEAEMQEAIEKGTGGGILDLLGR